MLKYILSLVFLLFGVLTHARQQTIVELRQELQKTSDNDTNKIIIYEKLINGYNLYKVDSAMYFLGEARKYADKLDFTKAKGLLFMCESRIKEGHGELPEARKLVLKSIEIFYHIDYSKGVATAYNQLGVIEAKLGNYSQATSYFLRALNINERIKNNNGIVQNSISLGVVNIHMENFDKAYKYLNRALSIMGKDSINVSYCNILNNLGTIFAMKADFKTALSYFQRCYVIAGDIINPALEVTLATNIANAYANLNEPQKAMEYYQKSVEISKAQGIPEEEARAIYNMALLFQIKEPQKSLPYLEEALKIAKGINQKFLQVDIYETLYVVKKKLGDYKGACEASEQYMTYRDSVKSDQTKDEIALLQSNFELERSKAEIKELEFQTQKQAFQKLISFVIIAAILVILIIVAYTSYKRNKLNKALVHSLQVREKLLSIITHDLKSPINNVLSLLLELESEDLSPVVRKELFEVLKKQTQMSLVTLENILQWGQAQLRGIKTSPEIFNLQDIIQKNIDLFEINAKQKNISLHLDIEPNAKANADVNQIDFVIRNLISNAIKFSNTHSSIQIGVKNEGSNLYKVTIKDSGVGMSRETINSLFGVQQQIRSGTAQEKGSGLGLLLCKEFVEANNGTIGADSTLGEGSTFYFTCKAA